MNDQEIYQKLSEDGWQHFAYTHSGYIKGNFLFHFCAFGQHEIIELHGKKEIIRFLGTIRNQADYRSLMKMLNIK